MLRLGGPYEKNGRNAPGDGGVMTLLTACMLDAATTCAIVGFSFLSGSLIFSDSLFDDRTNGNGEAYKAGDCLLGFAFFYPR